MIAHNTQ